MYILKNAWINVKRAKGRNLLIGIIITIVTLAACIALAIYHSASTLVKHYQETNSLEVTFAIDRMGFRENRESNTELTIEPLNEELIAKIGDSDYISSYYYTMEGSASSDQITAVTDNFFGNKEDSNTENSKNTSEKFISRGGMNIGDYRFTAYSDVSYLDSFLTGTSKITSGSFFTNDEVEPVMVISEELANENNLAVGDTVTFYTTDSTNTFTLTIVGIYSTTEDTSSDNFMGMSAMNVGNQIYTNLSTMNTYFSTDNNKNQLSPKFYLKTASDYDAFVAEVKEKGLSEYYTATSNLDTLMEQLEPISNVSNFSMIFLVIILIVGGVVIAIINSIQIRERKYEVGVMRAIGMSKGKVIMQFLSEICIVAILSLLIGSTSGTLLSQPVTNQLLQSEISKQQESVDDRNTNFGRTNMDRGSFSIGNNPKITYIDSLDVQVSFGTVMGIFGINLVLIMIGGLICAIFINQYEPNKILQNRT